MFVSFFSRSTGIRDDLEFLLEKELSNVQLCAFHMEMRNTEQLLGSIELVVYKNDCLKERCKQCVARLWPSILQGRQTNSAKEGRTANRNRKTQYLC